MLGDLNINTLLYQKGNLYGCEPLSWRSDVSMYKFRSKAFLRRLWDFPGKKKREEEIYIVYLTKVLHQSYRFKRSTFIFSIEKQTNERISVKIIFHEISLNITFPTYSHPKELMKDDQKSFEYYSHVGQSFISPKKYFSRVTYDA